MFSLTKFVINGYVNQRAWEDKHQAKPIKKFTDVKDKKETYDQNIKPYYEAAQKRFNQLCKEGKIESDELYLLRVLIEECLGTSVIQYKGTKFKNGFHRVYTYLKCWELDKSDFSSIMDYLNEIDQNKPAKARKPSKKSAKQIENS
jgi:hypothetical protein